MRIWIAMAAGLALAACGGAPDETTAAEPASADAEVAETGAEITVTDAFVMAPIGGRDISMGGLNVAVVGGEARLIGAEVGFAEVTELHTMAMNDGVMQMRMVEGFDIADGETLALERGGNHLMFFGVSELVAGESESVSLTFELADGETVMVETSAEVRALGE